MFHLDDKSSNGRGDVTVLLNRDNHRVDPGPYLKTTGEKKYVMFFISEVGVFHLDDKSGNGRGDVTVLLTKPVMPKLILTKSVIGDQFWQTKLVPLPYLVPYIKGQFGTQYWSCSSCNY